MKIMTFNIQHGVVFDDPEKKIDLAAFADYINAVNPDILGINEIRGSKIDSEKIENINEYNAPQAKILASLTGMRYYFAPAIESKNGLYGNALLSRFDMGESTIIPIPSPPEDMRIFSRYENRCLLKSRINTGSEEITVFVCHMGLNPQERLSAVEKICHELDSTEGKKILMGDFNMTPDNELLAPIYDRLVDTEIKMSGNILTFPSDSPERKIDYIFASRDLKIISAKVPDRYISDHRVIIAEIE